MRHVMPEARQAEPVRAPEPKRPAAPRALDAEAQLVAHVDDAPAPERADAEAPPSESAENAISAPVDAIDIPEAADVPDAPLKDQSAPSDWDEYDDDLDEEEPHSDNPFAGALAGIRKLGGVLRNLGGAIKRQASRPQPVESEADEDEVAPAAPEAQEAVIDDLQAVRIEPQTPIASAEPADGAGEDAGLSRRARRAAENRAKAAADVPAEVKSPYARPDESDEDGEAPQRKRFSLFGSPSHASANQDDDEDEDITPSGGRTPLFGRGPVDDDVAVDEHDEADAPIGLSEQLAESLDDAPRSRRRRRRAAAEPEAGVSKEDASPLDEVDEPTMAFTPLRRREEPEDDQRTRRFSPVRAQSETEDDEGEAEAPAPRSARRRGLLGRGAQPVTPEEDEEDEDEAPPPRRRGLLGRGAQPVFLVEDDEDEEEDEEEDEAPPPRRKGLFGRGARPIPPADDEDDEEEDEAPPPRRKGPFGRGARPAPIEDDEDDEDEDLPVRRYARGATRDGVRIYQDEDDYDDDYEGDYERGGDYDDEEYDEYDEYDAPMSFGKRVLRFFKGLLIIALLLLVAVIALRQLEANGKLSLNWMRNSVGVLVPLDGVFPVPEPTVAPEGLAEPAGLVNPTVDPLPTPRPTAEVPTPSQGVAIGEDSPAATATAQFVEEEPLEATD